MKELIDRAVHHVARNASRNTPARPLGQENPRLTPEVAEPAVRRWWPFWRVSRRVAGLRALVFAVESGVVSSSGASFDAVSVDSQQSKSLVLVTTLGLSMSAPAMSSVVRVCFQPRRYPVAHSQEAAPEDASGDPRDDINKASYAKATHGTPDRESPGELAMAYSSDSIASCSRACPAEFFSFTNHSAV